MDQRMKPAPRIAPLPHRHAPPLEEQPIAVGETRLARPA
jgi:hypothetical protein